MADDVVVISTVGTGQSIDNAAVTRADGKVVERQRITLKGDLTAEQPALIEVYLLQLIELTRQLLAEAKIQSHLIQEGFSSNPVNENLENLRLMTSAWNDLQPR